MKIFRTLFLYFLLAAALPPAAFALDLDQAKSQGLVGETDSGYLAAVKGGNAEVDKLVDGVNDGRRKAYRKLADQNNVPLAEVEKLAARKALEKTPGGEMVRIGGQWRRK